jgi:uncharacterized membrane protein
MGIIRRTKQGGSVLAFVIIGVILAAGLAGAIYWVKQRGEQAREYQTNIAYEQQQSDEKPTKTDDIRKSEPVTSGGSNKSSESTTTTIGADKTETANTQSALPATGPENVIIESLGACLLAMATTSYVMSRRNLMKVM